MAMEHRLGTINLVRWQGRRNRRLKAGVSVWLLVVAVCALVGCGTLTAQVLGLLTWSGPLAALPAFLVLVALVSQVGTIGRAAIAWLVG